MFHFVYSIYVVAVLPIIARAMIYYMSNEEVTNCRYISRVCSLYVHVYYEYDRGER